MAGTFLNLFLLGFLFVTAFLCVAAPLAALAFMFWQWHKELAQGIRLKHVRSTQVR
jgi:Flp pilus assembly protein TadB